MEVLLNVLNFLAMGLHMVYGLFQEISVADPEVVLPLASRSGKRSGCDILETLDVA